MGTLVLISQSVVAIGLLNVWLLRRGKATAWRGGSSSTMKEEFEVYGLPSWSMGIVGTLKVTLALTLLAGIWVPSATAYAAGGIAVLMAGAVAMHVKVGDPLRKSLPAFSLLVMALFIAVS